jgi:hypothetical protein
MVPHQTRARLDYGPAKYNVIHSGRRAYKTEGRKRRMIRLAAKYARWGADGNPFRGLITAPTHQQVKDIYWKDLLALIPKRWRDAGTVSVSELSVTLPWGAYIRLCGMDKPERAEGTEWDYMVLDEYGNMKPDVWEAHMQPMLTARLGWADFVGVPEGRNHYYQLHLRGLDPGEKDWATWGWHSDTVQPPEWVRDRKENMDEMTFDQECGGLFVAWQGRAYHCFDPALHVRPMEHQPGKALVFCFDFNVSPGVAAVCQEQGDGTGVIGEVWIPRNSTTERVCNRLAKDWSHHKGPVLCYGDATGGAGGSAKVQGSDWDIIRSVLRPAFGARITFKVPKSNPRERARVNAVNSRLRSANGVNRLFVDAAKAPHMVADLDFVALLEGGSGEIDKKKTSELTHMSDALGYYVNYEFPVEQRILKATGPIFVGGGAGVG